MSILKMGLISSVTGIHDEPRSQSLAGIGQAICFEVAMKTKNHSVSQCTM